MSLISENLEKIRSSIPNHVKILGVTKNQPLELVKEAVENGIFDLGINYAQAGEELQPLLSNSKIRWHFIGHIQSRKVKYLTSYNMIQSLDRIEVAKLLDEKLKSLSKQMAVLVEVNIGEEESKSGILEKDLDNFIEEIQKYPNLILSGLMFMPPPLENLEERRPYFKKAHALFKRYSSLQSFNTLSMGTSEDYLIAVEEGSNMVRLGTVLFGKRTLVV